MNVKAHPAQLHYPQQIENPLIQSREPLIALQRRALSAIGLTLVLLILTCTLDVFSVWASVATSMALVSLSLLNILTTTLAGVTGVVGIVAATTFVSYRAQVLHCGSPGIRNTPP